MGWQLYDQNGQIKQATTSVAINPAVGLDTTTTGIPNTSADTVLGSWTNETFKTLPSMHSAGVDGKLFAPVTGRYDVSAFIRWPGAPTNTGVRIRKNGTTYVADSGWVGSQLGAGCAATVQLNVGEYIEMLVAQSSATSPFTPSQASFTLKYADGAIQTPAVGATRHSCKAKVVAAQSLGAGADIFINFDGEEWDSDGYHDPAVPTRMTIPPGLGGIYHFEVIVAAANPGSNSLQGFWLRKNGSTALALNAGGGNYGPSFEQTLGGGRYELCVPGDYFEVGYHMTGLSGNFVEASFAAVMISP